MILIEIKNDDEYENYVMTKLCDLKSKSFSR